MKINIIIGSLVLLAFIGFFLSDNYQSGLLVIIPYLLILSCPLIHIFMHSKHGHHHGDTNSQPLKRNKHD